MPCVPPVVCCDPCRSSGEVLDSGYGTLTFDKPDVAYFRDNTIFRTFVNPLRLLTVQFHLWLIMSITLHQFLVVLSTLLW